MKHFNYSTGEPIKEGDSVKCSIYTKTGEQTSGRGRSKQTYSVHEHIEVEFIVRYGLFKHCIVGEVITWYLETPQSITYNTGFWKGTGRTLSEKRANESRPHTSSLDTILSKGLADKLIKLNSEQGVQECDANTLNQGGTAK